MPASHAGDRARLAVVVWAVLVSQVLLYPGLEDLTTALGGSGDIRAGMWFLVAEFAAFLLFAGGWGLLSDALGKRVVPIVCGAVGGAASYLLLPHLPQIGVGFAGVLGVRFLGGALTIGAFSLGITMLMDLAGGAGRNMGAAGIAIGLGAAIGSVLGGQLTELFVFAPVYAAGAVLLVAGALAATVTDRAPDSGRQFGDILGQVRGRPELGAAYAFGFVDRLTAGFFSLVGIFYFRNVFGLDAAAAGLTLALFFVPFALLQYPLGVLSDRIGRFVPMVGGSVLYGVTIVAVGAAPVYPLAAGLMVLVGAGGALVAPATMAFVTTVVDPSERGLAMGGFNVFGSAGFLTGFLLGGSLVAATDYTTAFLVVGALEIGIAVTMAPFVRGVERLGGAGPTHSGEA